MKNEVVKQESNVPVYLQRGEAKATITLDKQDLFLPKILAMQGTSPLVSQRKAMIGELRDSLSGKLLGDPDSPCEVIPFRMDKQWVIFQVDGTNVKFREIVPMTPENINWEWNETIKEEGKEVHLRRDYTYVFYVVLPSDLKEGIFLPYAVSFRRTSAKIGRQLVTQMSILETSGRVCYAKTRMFSTKLMTNDLGTFAIFTMGEGRWVTNEEAQAMQKITKQFSETNYTIDNSDVVNEAKVHSFVNQGAEKASEEF